MGQGGRGSDPGGAVTDPYATVDPGDPLALTAAAVQSAARRGAPAGTAAAAGDVLRVHADQGETELRDPATNEIVGIVDVDGVDRFPTTQEEYDRLKTAVRAALAAGGGADAAANPGQAAAMAATAERIASDASGAAPTATSELAEPAPRAAAEETASDEYVAADPGSSGGGGYDGGYDRSYGQPSGGGYRDDGSDYVSRSPARSRTIFDDGSPMPRLEDFMRDYDGDGRIGAADRAQASRALMAALRERGASRQRGGAEAATGFDPFARPESPIRAMILDALAASLPTVAARRGASRQP